MTCSWVQGQAIQDFALALIVLVSRRVKRRHVMVASTLPNIAWVYTISLARGLAVQPIWDAIDNFTLISNKRIWYWTAKGEYFAKLAYRGAPPRSGTDVWRKAHLEYLGAVEGENLHVASIQSVPLDRRPKTMSQTQARGVLLSMWARRRNHRPLHRLLLYSIQV